MINVRSARVRDEGGCMACRAHDADANGDTPDAAVSVVEVIGRLMTFPLRLCDECRAEMVRVLHPDPLTAEERRKVEHMRARGTGASLHVRQLLAIIDRLAPSVPK